MKNISLPRNERKRFYDSIVDNTTTYNYYVERLTDIAVSRFKWTGFPDSIDTRFLELTLFEKGQAVVFEDDVMGLLALNTAISGSWNVYNVPIKRRAYATNGYNKNLTIENSVIVFNNYIRTPSIQHILNFSKKLANIDVTIQININTQKTPIALKANKKQQLSVLNAYKNYDGNVPVIFKEDEFKDDSISSMSLGAPFVSPELYELKTKIWNEALTFLGVPNISETKKERMITDEVQRQMGGVLASRTSFISMRKQACEKINKMFGLNVDVEYNYGGDGDCQNTQQNYDS